MTTDRLASGLLRAARQILGEARASRSSGIHYRTVRQAQEASELALKAALAALGVDYPRRHAFGAAAESALVTRAGVPAERAREVVASADALAAKRGLAFYGAEAEGIPPDEALTTEDAAAALAAAEDVVSFVAALVARVAP